MRKAFASALVLVCSVVFLGAQSTKAERKDVAEALKDMFDMSKMATLNRSKVDKPGGVYVVASDGIQSEVTIQSGNVPTYIVDGKIRLSSDKGAGSALSSVLSGRTREDAKMLKKGDRVYVTNIHGFGNGLAVEIVTVDTFPIVDQRRTRQVAYKATLLFQNADKKMPDDVDAAGFKKLIDNFIVSEAEATAVHTKTIQLGQTRDQVEQILGKPENIIDLGAKVTYVYKNMKVIFMNGKVSDVQ